MSETQIITELTPQQEALIPIYQDKWRNLALSTKRIDRQKATEAIKAAYAAIGKQAPKIIFYKSPAAALYTAIPRKIAGVLSCMGSELRDNQLRKLPPKLRWKLPRNLLRSVMGHSQYNNMLLEHQFHFLLIGQILRFKQQIQPSINPLKEAISDRLFERLSELLSESLNRQLWSQLSRQIERQLFGHRFNDYFSGIHPEIWALQGCLFDFCINVLSCKYNKRKWLAYQSLVMECGWIFPFKEICFVCERPTKLSFDNQQLLHAEGEPAIQFADGFSVFAYHGIRLPKKYASLHPQKWKSQWLLKEENAELRRVLIQGIGYERICQDLQAIELDEWQEYTLLKIDTNIDVEPIYLLKMTCPSTGLIHALRVPPDVTSAREAIRWINWGVAPEEFSVQT